MSAVVLMLVLAGCSSGADSGSSAGLQPAPRTPSATTTPVPTRTPAAATKVDSVGDIDCPTSAPNFAGQQLTDDRFGIDLTCATFAGAELTNVSFSATSLNGADFTGAVFTTVSFDSVSTRGTDFTNAVFIGVEFEEADLLGAIFIGADLVSVSYEATICPDGVESDKNQATCMHNLG